MDNKQYRININNEHEITVTGGASLLSSLAEKQIFLPSACGGRGFCGTCRCKVLEGGGELSPRETVILSPLDISNQTRLSCQVQVINDIRILLPESIINIKRFIAVVEEITDYTYDIRGITFKILLPDSIEFQAGQFVQIESHTYERVTHSTTRAYSISSKPEMKDHLQLIVRKVPEGIVTTWIHDYLKVGDEVSMTGPWGNFIIQDTQADVFFISGGSGLAPIKAMLEHLEVTGSNRYMVNFFGAKSLKDLYLVDYMNHFNSVFPHYEYIPVLSSPDPEDNWNGKTGYTMTFFQEKIRDPKNTEAYLCGSPGMINAVQKALTELGIPKEKIYFDSF